MVVEFSVIYSQTHHMGYSILRSKLDDSKSNLLVCPTICGLPVFLWETVHFLDAVCGFWMLSVLSAQVLHLFSMCYTRSALS